MFMQLILNYCMQVVLDNVVKIYLSELCVLIVLVFCLPFPLFSLSLFHSTLPPLNRKEQKEPFSLFSLVTPPTEELSQLFHMNYCT